MPSLSRASHHRLDGSPLNALSSAIATHSMAPSFINRLFQSTAQPCSSQQALQAATPPTAPPTALPASKAMAIGREAIERPVYLTIIFSHREDHYRYSITFSGNAKDADGRVHSYDEYRGYIRVPEERVNERIQGVFHRDGKVSLAKGDITRAVAVLGKIIDIDDEYYTRQMQVTHGPRDTRYLGKCYIPRSEETPTRWQYEEATVKSSIEAIPIEPEPRRTVVFRGKPHQGKKVQVEVYALKGDDYYRGAADVYSLEHRMDDDVQRTYLTIYAPVAYRQYLWLRGEYPENGSNRYGPFVQIDEPEEVEEEEEEEKKSDESIEEGQG